MGTWDSNRPHVRILSPFVARFLGLIFVHVDSKVRAIGLHMQVEMQGQDFWNSKDSQVVENLMFKEHVCLHRYGDPGSCAYTEEPQFYC